MYSENGPRKMYGLGKDYFSSEYLGTIKSPYSSAIGTGYVEARKFDDLRSLLRIQV